MVISDYIPFNVWPFVFMIEQGYDIPKNILFQNNQSAIKMEKLEETHALVIIVIFILSTSLLRIDLT